MARLDELRPDANDAEVVDLLATWLAEVSAEATLRLADGDEDLPRADTAR
ncbi:MAG: hypothetical protein WEE66_05670 [Actinomycetota bacterium]